MSRTGFQTAPEVLRALAGMRGAWAEVSLDAIAHNARAIRRHVGRDRRLLAVVKANAYGHGAAAVSRRLEAEGAELLGVAFPEEGFELRRAGIRAPILVLGAADAGQIEAMRAASIVPTVYSASLLEAVLAAASRSPSPSVFQMKVDTGMGRLGLLPEELPAALARIAALGGRAVLDGVFTTLSCSDDPHDPHTAAQVALFGDLVARVRASGVSPTYIHTANSGGIIDHPPSWLDTVRPGIMLYGIHPSDSSSRMDLRPALSLKGRLALVKQVPAGTPLGYGRSFVTTRSSVIGTVPIGYADGLSRRAALRGHTLVRGLPAPFSGRISMDHFMVDLTDIPGAAEGDEVVLIGRQGERALSAAQLAEWTDTIPYEVLCRLGPRLPRIHIEMKQARNNL